MKVKVKLFEGGVMPKKQRAEDACFDCYARVDEEVKLMPGERAKIPLGFALELPAGWEAVLRPRSGLTSKGIDNGIGTIDENYRGELCAGVINNTNIPNPFGLVTGESFIIRNGDRICQMAIREAPAIELEQVDELSETERGSCGFGSSGV